MCRAVIQNDVQILILWCAAFDLAQKINELFGSMAFRDFTNHLSIQNVQRRIKAGCAVSLVIMGLALNLSRSQLKIGLGSVQCLDLRFFINREYQCVIGWVQVKTHHIK